MTTRAVWCPPSWTRPASTPTEHFGNGSVQAGDVASSLIGAVVKDPVQDAIVWEEYLERVVKEHYNWNDLYRACRDTE